MKLWAASLHQTCCGPYVQMSSQASSFRFPGSQFSEKGLCDTTMLAIQISNKIIGGGRRKPRVGSEWIPHLAERGAATERKKKGAGPCIGMAWHTFISFSKRMANLATSVLDVMR